MGGTLFLRNNSKQNSSDLDWVFDEEEPSQTCGDVKLTLFMKLTVQVSLDTSDVQHEKLAVRLVHPNIEGFSVPPAYRQRRAGERKRKSARGCIVDNALSVLNLVVVKKGEADLPGVTDGLAARRLGPKRASKIRKLFA